MTREVSEDEAALLDALAAQKPRREALERLKAHVAQCEADLEVARKALEAHSRETEGFVLAGSKEVLTLVQRLAHA